MLLITTVILAIASILFYLKFKDERNINLWIQGNGNPYNRKKSFLTGNERRLFEILQSIPQLRNYYIFPQLHLSSILEVKDDQNDLKGKFEWLNSLFPDFILFEKESLNPVLVIELNDNTHAWQSRKARDQFVSNALDANDIPLAVLHPNDLGDSTKVQNIILSAMKNLDKS